MWKEIASNELDGMTLVNGMNTHEVLEDSAAKNDVPTMLACCKAELQRADIGEALPAPYYFKRAAILFYKQKEYDNEIKICELYCDTSKKFGIDVASTNIQARIQKALLNKDRAQKKSD